jgi:hypothetical protein
LINFEPRILRRATVLAVSCLACLAPAGASASATLPSLRPGFWQSSSVMLVNMQGQPPDTDSTPTIRYNCFDTATMEKSMKLLTSGGMANCKTDIEGAGNTYTMTVSCPSPTGGAGTIKTNGTMVFDGNTSFHTVTTGSSNIPSMQMTIHAVDDAKWLGACPAGVVPGDYGTMTNGVFAKTGNTNSK